MTAQLRPDISTTSLGDLVCAHVAPLREGCLAWVEAELDYFKLEKSSGAATDGINIVAPLAGSPSAGAAAARWIRLSTSSSGGTGLAFLNIAEMAAFNVAPLTKGATCEVLSLEDIWNYDPNSTLPPDVTAGSPLGRTIVAANGVGNWLRDRQFASLRWKEQPNWRISPLTGDDEADGFVTPLWSWDELQDRIGGFARATVAYDVELVDELLAPIVIDTRHSSGVESLFFHGPLTVIPFGALATGVLTAVTDWNPATQTIGTITSADIPVSWTASGMIEKLVIEVETGVCAWIMQDNGAKVARVSAPRLGPFDPTPATFTPGNHVQVYELLQLGTTVSVISDGGPGEQVDFQYLHLGEGLVHGLEVKSGGAILDGCHIHGLDSVGGAGIDAINCAMIQGARAEQGSAVLLEGGYAPANGLDARGGTIDLAQFTVYDTIQAQQTGVIRVINSNGFLCWVDVAGTCCRVQPSGQLDAATNGPAYMFGVGCTGTAFQILAQGSAQFDHDKPPVFGGVATEVQLGNRVTLFAELPYTNPIDQSSMVEADSPNGVEYQFVALAADMTITAVTTATLISLAIVVNGLRQIVARSSFGFQPTGASVSFAQLHIDAINVQGLGSNKLVTDPDQFNGAHLWSATLAAGAHTVALVWSAQAGALFCRPVVVATNESATLDVAELNG